MSIGEIAGLIAALAFAVLVVFISINLSKLSTIMKEIRDTVQRLNSTIDIVTKDVDNLSIEVEGLLNKANTLVDDVNGKLSKTDPLFTAIGDLGVTVSDVNSSTKQLTSNLLSGVTKKKSSPLERFIKVTRSKPKTQTPTATPNQSFADTTVNISEIDSESELVSLTKTKPSSTAGEINLK